MAPSDYQDQDFKTPKVEVVDPFDAQSGPVVNQAQKYWLQFQQWFDRLSWPAKTAVAIAILFVSFSLLTQMLKFVASLVSLAILLVILFGLYRFFLKADKTS